MKISKLAMVLIFLAACSQEIDYDPAHDYLTFANTDQFVTRQIALDLDVDFKTTTLAGSVVLTLQKMDPDAREIVLDTRDLSIHSVGVVGADGSVKPATYRVGERHEIKGAPLIITLPSDLESNTSMLVQIAYTTSANASALQWLPAELTAGGKHPMMFSQAQAIHARSFIPLQDTPSVRVTYEATIRTPPELLAVMSANNDPLTPRNGEYHFEMPQPIPSYLIAIAVGNLYFAPLGEDTGVYAEPEMLDASVYEFADTQDMLEIAEIKFGPYQWGRYDLLILPPSFPYGGMENPRLSFLTPSLLAGDRSLVAVVAHELAHSWSGNLVTNATWRDGWLNEGVTSYLESRLMEILYDKDRVDEERVLNYEELLQNFAVIPAERQGLAPRIDTRDSESGQGTISYLKGQMFLEYLENGFGRDRFDPFLFTYFRDFSFQTITTEAFVDYLDANLLGPNPGIISRADVEAWMYQAGLPEGALIPSSSTLTHAAALAGAWSVGEATLDDLPLEDWSPQALIHFINSLPDDLSQEALARLDGGLDLSGTRNAEIARAWFIQVAKRRYEPAYEQMAAYVNRYGRMRLIGPVYSALAANGHDKALAESIFANARSTYHPITIASIEKTLAQAGVAK
ncbi:MAG: M1 family metallopeptidase [Gammaproteobacteria bacterium]|nr:M1 family metallopeptidase [Gammaproteobacteria bacterium]MDH5584247.1 M1 family metallopeptidase [Gammaproteobacteria bacterium]